MIAELASCKSKLTSTKDKLKQHDQDSALIEQLRAKISKLRLQVDAQPDLAKANNDPQVFFEQLRPEASRLASLELKGKKIRAERDQLRIERTSSQIDRASATSERDFMQAERDLARHKEHEADLRAHKAEDLWQASEQECAVSVFEAQVRAENEREEIEQELKNDYALLELDAKTFALDTSVKIYERKDLRA